MQSERQPHDGTPPVCPHPKATPKQSIEVQQLAWQRLWTVLLAMPSEDNVDLAEDNEKNPPA